MGWAARQDRTKAPQPPDARGRRPVPARRPRSAPRPSTLAHAGRCVGSKVQVSETASTPRPDVGRDSVAHVAARPGSGRGDQVTNAPGRQKRPRRGTHASLCGTSVVLPPSYLQPRESAWRTAGARQLCHRPETSRGWVPSSVHFLVSRLPRVSLALFRPAWAPRHPGDWWGRGRHGLGGPSSLGFISLPPAPSVKPNGKKRGRRASRAPCSRSRSPG